MTDDSLMTNTDLLAQQQVLETFKGLAPLLGTAQLAPNPRESKRSKRHHDKAGNAAQPTMQVAQTPQLQQLNALVQQLALLVLRHDRESTRAVEQTASFFFSTETQRAACRG